MQTDIDPRDLIGHKAVDRNGDKIGTVDEVYLDDATGQPEWAAVRTGIFGRDAFVPLTTSEFSGDELRVPYDKSLVKESPDFGVGQHLSPAQELQLYRYYGLDTPADGRPAAGDGSGSQPADLDFGSGTGVPAAAAAAGTAAAAARPTEPPRSVPSDSAAGAADPAATARTAAFTTSSNATTMPVPQVTETAPPASAPISPAVPLTDKPGLDKPGLDRPAEANVRPVAAPEQGRTAEPVRAAEPVHAVGPAGSAPGGPVEITCREERLDITTEWHILGTAKLRKYVTSEAVERRVAVVRERVRVERMPVGEAERAALTDKEIAEAVEEVTLREERPVVRKYLAPIERVRLVVERYTAEEVVRDELRREHVEVHDNTAAAAPMPASGHSAPESTPPTGGEGRPAPLRPLV
ncbi:PRC and DUF2382 domain-containing protein [Kitasatospora sp. NPDC054939]